MKEEWNKEWETRSNYFPYFRRRTRKGGREKEEIGRDGRDVDDSIRERRHVLDSNAPRFLTRPCIYRSGGKVGSKRLRLRNTSCNRIRTSFPVVLDGELAVLSEIVSDDVARFSLCSITSLHYYCLGTGRHREASSTRKSLPESLNVSPAFQTAKQKNGRGALTIWKVHVFGCAFPFIAGLFKMKACLSVFYIPRNGCCL